MKKNSELTKRQIEILKIIIDEYTKTPHPLGSKYIAEQFLVDFSSQTVRNEMAMLEKLGYLEKTHTSSGRIPSVKAFEFYEQKINLQFNLDLAIQEKLKNIFKKRADGIDVVIDESLNIINEITSLPSISNSVNVDTELISKISAVQLDAFNGIIILVTSSGHITKSSFGIKNQEQFNDVEICIDIFNKYLVKTPLNQIKESLFKIEKIIKKNVHEYEFISKEIFMRIFAMARTSSTQKIVGISSIFAHQEFQDPKKIAKIVEMIEKGNIWKQIRFDKEQKAVSLKFNTDIPDSPLAIASTKIKINQTEHQISVIGPDRMNYAPIKAILNFLKKELEEIFNNQNETDKN